MSTEISTHHSDALDGRFLALIDDLLEFPAAPDPTRPLRARGGVTIRAERVGHTREETA